MRFVDLVGGPRDGDRLPLSSFAYGITNVTSAHHGERECSRVATYRIVARCGCGCYAKAVPDGPSWVIKHPDGFEHYSYPPCECGCRSN